MDSSKDIFKELKSIAMQRAILFTKHWTDLQLSEYPEPTRLHTPKGHPIGFPKKKMLAAMVMILYPNCLTLNEIAGTVHTSVGTLRVWRTEGQFKKVINVACETLGREFRNIIETAIDTADMGEVKRLWHYRDLLNWEVIKDPQMFCNGIVSMLPMFDVRVSMPLLDHFVDVMEITEDCDLTNVYAYSHVFHNYEKALSVKDGKSYRQWLTEPRILSHTKRLIQNQIAILTHPQAAKEFGADTIQKDGRGLADYIGELLDTLAG